MSFYTTYVDYSLLQPLYECMSNFGARRFWKIYQRINRPLIDKLQIEIYGLFVILNQENAGWMPNTMHAKTHREANPLNRQHAGLLACSWVEHIPSPLAETNGSAPYVKLAGNWNSTRTKTNWLQMPWYLSSSVYKQTASLISSDSDNNKHFIYKAHRLKCMFRNSTYCQEHKFLLRLLEISLVFVLIAIPHL